MNELYLVFWLRGFIDCIKTNGRQLPTENEWKEINERIDESMCWIIERVEK